MENQFVKACEKGDFEGAQYLLDMRRGSSKIPDFSYNNFGLNHYNTALYRATFNKHYNVIIWLLTIYRYHDDKIVACLKELLTSGNKKLIKWIFSKINSKESRALAITYITHDSVMNKGLNEVLYDLYKEYKIKPSENDLFDREFMMEQMKSAELCEQLDHVTI